MSINRYDLKEAVLLARSERDAELLRLTTLRELPKSLFFSKPAASALPATHRGGWKGRPVIYSHGEVYKMVESVAATMRESGVRPATVCALVAPSGSLEAAVFFLALVWIGAVAAPIDAGLDSEGLAVALQACAATIVVSPIPDEGADGDMEEGDGGEPLEVGARVARVAKKMGLVSWHLFRTTNEGVKLEMHGARAGVSAAWKGGSADYKVDPEEVAVHLLASPPTLDPAGGDLGNAHVVDVVRLTHRNLVTSARMFATSYKLQVEQTTLLTCALHDAHGLVVLLATLLSGGQLVLPPAMAAPEEIFAADMFWPLVSSFELDWLSASPANLRILSAGESFPDKSSIAFVRVATGLHTSSKGSASADDALSVEEVGFLADKVFRAPVLPAYGPAAAAGHAAANTSDASGESPGTFGKPVPNGVRLAILDPVTRAYLPKGHVGDVAVSGDGASSAVLAGAGRDEEAVRKLFLHEVFDDVEDEEGIQVHAAVSTTAPVAGKYSTMAAAPVPMSQSARAADRGKHDWDSDTGVSDGVYRNLPPLSARASATASAVVAAAGAAARPATVWFMTGDRGKLDEDGFLVVVGDAREMRAAEARKLALAAAVEQRRKEEEDAAIEVRRRAEEAKAEEAERRRAAGLEPEKDEAEAALKADDAKLAAAAALAAAGGAGAARDSWMRRQSNEADSSINRSVRNNDGSAMRSFGSLGATEDGRMKLDRSSAQSIVAHLDRLAAGQATLEAELTAAHKARMDVVRQRLQAAEALAVTRRQEMRRDADAAAARNAAVANSAAAAAADPAVMEVSVDEAQAAIMCAAAASEESAQATAAAAAAAQAAAAAAAAAERASEATAAEVRKLPPPPSAAEKAMKLAVAAAASERAIAASKAAAERSAAAALLDVVDPNNVTKVVAVSLDDVEAAVEGHPAVASARAFGRPDPRFGSEIYCAVVVKGGGRLSEPWLLLHVQSLLPAAAVPRRFYVVDETTIAADRSVLAADTKLRPLSGVSGYAGAAVVRPPTWVPKSRRVQASV